MPMVSINTTSFGIIELQKLYRDTDMSLSLVSAVRILVEAILQNFTDIFLL